LIRIADCSDFSDDEQHYITFQKGVIGWHDHSETKSHEESYSGKDLEKLYSKNMEKKKRIDKPFIDDLFLQARKAAKSIIEDEKEEESRGFKKIEEKIFPILDYDPSSFEEKDVFAKTSNLLSVIFGVTLVIVGIDEEVGEGG
jgi:hypothetical protein